MVIFSEFDKNAKIRLFKGAVIAALTTMIITTAFFIFNYDPPVAEYNGIVYSTSAADEEEIQKFAEQFGLKTKKEPVFVKEITIPEQFNEVYEHYNDIQKSVGLDLEKYKKAKCRLLSYRLDGYNGDDRVLLNLIICDDRVVAGDISEEKYNGFMLSLAGESVSY